jgi:hypothetical protein
VKERELGSLSERMFSSSRSVHAQRNPRRSAAGLRRLLEDGRGASKRSCLAIAGLRQSASESELKSIGVSMALAAERADVALPGDGTLRLLCSLLRRENSVDGTERRERSSAGDVDLILLIATSGCRCSLRFDSIPNFASSESSLLGNCHGSGLETGSFGAVCNGSTGESGRGAGAERFLDNCCDRAGRRVLVSSGGPVPPVVDVDRWREFILALAIPIGGEYMGGCETASNATLKSMLSICVAFKCCGNSGAGTGV